VIGLPPKEQRQRTYHVLEMLALNHRLHNYPEQISGGEQQRVAIARALVNRPLILLADEPTGNLDPDLSREIMELFKGINSHGTTILIATHDREMIRRMGRRVIGLDHGRLVAPGAA
jgi:cell division transport system ATP-binding protein